MAMVMHSGEKSLIHKSINPLVAAGFNVLAFDQVWVGMADVLYVVSSRAFYSVRSTV